jgi:hypothetical protein
MIDTWRFSHYFLFCAKHGWSALREDHACAATKPGRGQKEGMMAILEVRKQPNSLPIHIKDDYEAENQD